MFICLCVRPFIYKYVYLRTYSLILYLRYSLVIIIIHKDTIYTANETMTTSLITKLIKLSLYVSHCLKLCVERIHQSNFFSFVLILFCFFSTHKTQTTHTGTDQTFIFLANHFSSLFNVVS